MTTAIVKQEPRFEFGANWQRFLTVLDEDRIAQAEASLRDMLGRESLQGLDFLDVGCGSGLFSLAAHRLGARVRSFDYDPDSVAATTALRRAHAPASARWTVERGSILDAAFVASLGSFDVVYAWGVLHHTGAMWEAMANAATRVRPGGQLFIALYNDQGAATAVWTRVKRLYNVLPRPLRFLVLGPAACRLWGPTLVRDTLRGAPLATWRGYRSLRGMSAWHDLVDWVGGYPFEAASTDAVVQFYAGRGFVPTRVLSRERGHGCNEFVLERRASDAAAG